MGSSTGMPNGPSSAPPCSECGAASSGHPHSQDQSKPHTLPSTHPNLHNIPRGGTSNSLPCHDGVAVPLIRHPQHWPSAAAPAPASAVAAAAAAAALPSSSQHHSRLLGPAAQQSEWAAAAEPGTLLFRGEGKGGAGGSEPMGGAQDVLEDSQARESKNHHPHRHHNHLKDSDCESEDEQQRQTLLGERGRAHKVSRAYDEYKRGRAALQTRILNVFLVSGDCFFLAMQPILVYLCKVDGKFLFDPISVNFLTEICKMAFATPIVLFQMAKAHRLRKGGDPLGMSAASSAFTLQGIWKAAKANTLLAVPAGLYSVNNYLKFVMQLYFKPTTVKMLGNLKILVIALLLKLVMRRKFSTIQWEAMALLLIGISVNQIPCGPDSDSSLLSISPLAWAYTFFSVTIPSAASVFNEYALKSQFDTSVHLQNFFMYCYGVLFNLAFLVIIHLAQGGSGLNIFAGHSRATALLIANNALQGILSSFFFKYADAILKKYSSTIATIFTALMSASLFGHALTVNFVLGVSVVIISMHQFFSAAQLAKQATRAYTISRGYPPGPRMADSGLARDSSLLEMAAGANEEANHHTPTTEPRHTLLPK